ncbi:MAG: hypothetical protein JWN86_783 [Planctomycetota bacterium]|nr:hypothetical protein [Planctomycetota bacterium]
MSQELHYTSAPRGLKPGVKGYCTVASTPHLPGPLAERLESLSGYKQVFPATSPDASRNPVVVSHLRISLGGQDLSVLSRVAAAGLDYTDRSNKYAHHVAITAAERPSAGPAWLAQRAGVLETAWEGEPRIIPTGRAIPSGDTSPAVCDRWGRLTGDPGWAGVLAETFLNDPRRVVYLIRDLGHDLLPLLGEAIALIPPSRRWEVTFSTYFTSLPQGLSCAWRGVLKDSAEATQARRSPEALVLDLTQPMGEAQGGPLVEQARTGLAAAAPPGPPSRSVPPPREELLVIDGTDSDAPDRAVRKPEPARGRDRYTVVPALPPELALSVPPPPRKTSTRPATNNTPYYAGLAAAAVLIFVSGLTVGYMAGQNRGKPEMKETPIGSIAKVPEAPTPEPVPSPKLQGGKAVADIQHSETPNSDRTKIVPNDPNKQSSASPALLSPRSDKDASGGVDTPGGPPKMPLKNPPTPPGPGGPAKVPIETNPAPTRPHPTVYFGDLQPMPAPGAGRSGEISRETARPIRSVALLGLGDAGFKDCLLVTGDTKPGTLEVTTSSGPGENGRGRPVARFSWKGKTLTYEATWDGNGSVDSFAALRECVLQVTSESGENEYYIFKKHWVVPVALPLHEFKGTLSELHSQPAKMLDNSVDSSFPVNWESKPRLLRLWLDSDMQGSIQFASDSREEPKTWASQKAPFGELAFEARIISGEGPRVFLTIKRGSASEWESVRSKLLGMKIARDNNLHDQHLAIPRPPKQAKVTDIQLAQAEAEKFNLWMSGMIPSSLKDDKDAELLIQRLSIIAPSVLEEAKFLTGVSLKYSLCVKVGDRLFSVSQSEFNGNPSIVKPHQGGPQ